MKIITLVETGHSTRNCAFAMDKCAEGRGCDMVKKAASGLGVVEGVLPISSRRSVALSISIEAHIVICCQVELFPGTKHDILVTFAVCRK